MALLTQRMPFLAIDRKLTALNILGKKLTTFLMKLPRDARHLLKRMLKSNPVSRITTEEMISHEWLPTVTNHNKNH